MPWRYSSDTPILLAGDFNFTVTGGQAAAAISRAHFQDALANHHVPTTPDSFLQDGRIIDWIFTRGPIRAGQSEVHRSVSASDHYPLSITLAFAWIDRLDSRRNLIGKFIFRFLAYARLLLNHTEIAVVQRRRLKNRNTHCE